MRKLWLFLLIVASLFSMTACGNKTFKQYHDPENAFPVSEDISEEDETSQGETEENSDESSSNDQSEGENTMDTDKFDDEDNISCSHRFESETCDAPKTCVLCGETQGSALGHRWTDATCVKAKTCSRCQKTSGNALGHDYESGVCKICKMADSNYIEYTVIYKANGGWGETISSTHIYNESRMLSKNAFKRAGYTFVGWHTDASAKTPKYTNTQSVKNITNINGATVTLYAIWKESSTAAFDECKVVESAKNNIKFHEKATDNTGKVHNDVAVLKLYQENIGTYSNSSERYTGGLFRKIKGTIIPKDGEYLDDATSVAIVIYADGVLVYKSEPLGKYSSAQSFEVNISGANIVKIRIRDCSDYYGGSSGELMIENLVLER